jgi:hypothetical protein
VDCFSIYAPAIFGRAIKTIAATDPAILIGHAPRVIFGRKRLASKISSRHQFGVDDTREPIKEL